MSFYIKYRNLIKKIIATSGILTVYRIGSYLSIPGVHQSILSDIVKNSKGSFFSMADLFSGGSLSRSSFFALSVFPYVSASLLVQMLSSSIGFEFFMNLKKQGEVGQIKLNAYTKYIALAIAFSYAVRYYFYIISSNIEGFSPLYISKILFFFVAIPNMLAGMMFLIWLGNQITKKGIGNGISLIIFTGIISNFPSGILKLFNTTLKNSASYANGLLFILFFIIVVSMVIIIEESYYNLPVEYPGINKFGTKTLTLSHFLPLKINNASIIPPIMSATVLMMIQFVMSTIQKIHLPIPQIHMFLGSFMHGQPLYYVLYGLTLAFFTIVYTPVAFEPYNLAENLKKEGCIVNNWRPGKLTGEKLQGIITNLAVLAAFYLTILCVAVDMVIVYLKVPVYFSGTSLMIAIGVAIETYKSFKSNIAGVKYEKITKQFGFDRILM